ncbi:MAG: hypothetical protein J0J04_05005 [Microbacterium sp.]|uniref:hypothetical protein n=1 Tax=Microbacterium sp. TaxID=51671 RepID=UPI001AC10207|nr:hypothetical protein [Microbacterium sp.]MBN9214167.1 hypothetical protein [Microbacterium sp.]
MSRLSGEIADKVSFLGTYSGGTTDMPRAVRDINREKAFATYAKRDGLEDVKALLREVTRLADDLANRTDAYTRRPEWGEISARVDVIAGSASAAAYGRTHIESDVKVLVAAIDALEAELVTLAPRP